MRNPLTLQFGERSFVIRPLTFGQVKKIFTLANKMNASAIPGASHDPVAAMAAAGEIVSIALMRDNPKEAENIDELETTMAEINMAMQAVFVHAGLTPEEETVMGEAEAGETPAPIGTGSEAA